MGRLFASFILAVVSCDQAQIFVIFAPPWHRLLTRELSDCPGIASRRWQCWPVYSQNQF